MRLTAILILLTTFQFANANTHLKPVKPNDNLTPGELCTAEDEDFVGYRYKEQLAFCERNVDHWTKTDIYNDYGVNLKYRGGYTIDHLVPLSIGGNNSVSNLWPEPKSVKRLRQNLEFEVYTAVKNGELTQAEAIQIILEAKFNPPVNQ